MCLTPATLRSPTCRRTRVATNSLDRQTMPYRGPLVPDNGFDGTIFEKPNGIGQNGIEILLHRDRGSGAPGYDDYHHRVVCMVRKNS